MANTNKPRAKVDLVTGFLGAGKTSLIKKYLRRLDALGVSYAVVENEFGAAGVDASILGGNVRELSGGCICCGQKVNFHNLLIETAAHADRIVVEPSGVFNADDFFDIMESPHVQAVCEYGLMAGVVDPYSLSGLTREDEEVLIAELSCAGAILLSRADRADPALMDSTVKRLHSLLGALPPVMTTQDTDFDRLMQCVPVFRSHIRMQADHSALFQCASLCPEADFSKAALAYLAEMLFSGEAGDVLRVKGVLRSGEGFLSLNAVKGETEIMPIEASAPVLNVIGRNLSRKVIRRMLSDAMQ